MSRSILGELENTISPEAVAVDRLAQGSRYSDVMRCKAALAASRTEDDTQSDE